MGHGRDHSLDSRCEGTLSQEPSQVGNAQAELIGVQYVIGSKAVDGDRVT